MIKDPVGRAWGPPVLIGGLRQQLPAPAALEIHSKGLPQNWGFRPGWVTGVPHFTKPAIWKWELGKRIEFAFDYWPSKEFLFFLLWMWNSRTSPCFHLRAVGPWAQEELFWDWEAGGGVAQGRNLGLGLERQVGKQESCYRKRKGHMQIP